MEKADENKIMICPHACANEECGKERNRDFLLCTHAEPHTLGMACRQGACAATGLKGICVPVDDKRGQAILLRLKIEGYNKHWGKAR